MSGERQRVCAKRSNRRDRFNCMVTANILFSAALPHSRMRVFLEVLRDRAQWLTNDYAIEEARRNLAAKYPDGLKALEGLAKQCEIVTRLEANLEVASIERRAHPWRGHRWPCHPFAHRRRTRFRQILGQNHSNRQNRFAPHARRGITALLNESASHACIGRPARRVLREKASAARSKTA